MAKRYQMGNVLLWFMLSDYPFGIFWQIVSSVLLRLMPSDYPFAICWPLYRLSYFDKCLLITPLVSFGHCIFRPTSINAFWLSLSYMLAIVSSVLLRFMPSDCHIGIFWPLYRLSYFNVCLLITTLISFGNCIICPTLIYAFWLPYWYLVAIVSSILLQMYALKLLITPLVYFGHCIVCPTLIYAFWLSLRYLLAIVSSVLLRLMPSDYPFGILWPLYQK
jgi:hypothetical protein